MRSQKHVSSNLCVDVVRAALKGPHEAAAEARETICSRPTVWKDGLPEKQGRIAPPFHVSHSCAVTRDIQEGVVQDTET